VLRPLKDESPIGLLKIKWFSPRSKTGLESNSPTPRKLVELRGIEPLTLRLPERKKGGK